MLLKYPFEKQQSFFFKCVLFDELQELWEKVQPISFCDYKNKESFWQEETRLFQ